MHLSKSKNKIESKKFTAWKGEFRLIGRDPFVDWVLIIAVSVVLALLLVYIGVVIYFDTDRDVNKSIEKLPVNISDIADVKSLNVVIDNFENRQAERARLSKGYGDIGDPSY